MSIFAAITNMLRKPAKAQKTRARRFKPHGFATPFGEVIDLSASGMKVRSPRNPGLVAGQKTSMRLSTQFQQVIVTARVAWVVADKLGCWSAGFQFVDLKPEVASAVEALAQHGFADVGQQPGPRRAGTQAPKSTTDADAPAPRSILEQRLLCEDLYELFGVEPTATAEDLHDAYRTMAQRLHPDRNTAPDASEKFSKLTRAYTMLKDPSKRERYDQMRANSKAKPGPTGDAQAA